MNNYVCVRIAILKIGLLESTWFIAWGESLPLRKKEYKSNVVMAAGCIVYLYNPTNAWLMESQ